MTTEMPIFIPLGSAGVLLESAFSPLSILKESHLNDVGQILSFWSLNNQVIYPQKILFGCDKNCKPEYLSDNFV